ncbi:MAG: 50S ribosomal protein L21 [Candidatus Saccharibacteria bacterium]
MLAVIETGAKQYIVEKGQKLEVELLHADKDKVEFKPLMIVDGENVKVGKPTVEGAVVTAEVASEPVKGEKKVILHYKAKKRQSVKTGHRQKYSLITITGIKA